MAKKKKTKTKTVYRNIKPAEPSINTGKIREELKSLESRKEMISKEIAKDKEGKKGFSKFAVGLGGVFRKGAVNKQISERRRTLGVVAGTERTREQIKLLKQRTELERAKQELSEVRSKNQVSFGGDSGIKPIRIEDIFR